MSERSNRKNKKKFANYRIISSITAVILILITAAVLFYLPQLPENSKTTDELQRQSFTERSVVGFADMELRDPPVIEAGTITDSTMKDGEAVTKPEVVIVEEAPVDNTNDNGGLEKPEEDLASMIANAKNYVYTLYTDLEQGSGFLYNDKGDILTNAHVVKDAAYVTVKNSNGQEFNGHIIGISEIQDIALVRVSDIAGKQPLEMELSPVIAGTKVFALGSPENIINTSTEGEISSTGNSFFDDYQYDELYEMTAKIKQGSSGGPLISAESGKVLGINSIVLTDNLDIGYAIPIYTILEQLEGWIETPLPLEEENILPDITQAYFSEELLRDFLADFYTLIPYSLNDDEIAFYELFLYPGSQAEQMGKEIVNNLKESNRTFEAVETVISSIEINEDEAVIYADANFTFHDDKKDKIISIRHSMVYKVIIDEYGDYQIISIENQ